MHKKSFLICFFSLAASLFLFSESAAEYNLATKKEEHLLFGTAREVKIGRSLAGKVEEKYEICQDVEIQKRVEEIGQKLVSVCDRKDITYFFAVLEGERANAFALPGGYVYVNKGLIERIDSDDEIAGVLAHEIGHIVARHSIKRLQTTLGYSLISLLALAATKDVRFKRGADLAFGQIMLGYSREDEFLADRLAVKYMRKSGYNPEAVITLLEKLKQIEKDAPRRPLVVNYLRSHPYLPERIAAAKQIIYGKMDFNDYINRADDDSWRQ